MSNKINILLIATALITVINMTSSAPNTSPSSSGLFAADLLSHIAKPKIKENVVFSPISIQMALAMAYLGADGKTAEELQKNLHLPSSEKDLVGQYFAQLLNKKSGEVDLSIANRMFVNSDFSLKTEFNEKAEKYFKSGTETLNFKDLATESIQIINKWVEQKTNNKITDLLKPGSIDADTLAIIVNAIYFKGKWQQPFSLESTMKKAFWISNEESLDVDFMYGGDRRLNYGDIPELNATAVELPYENSDMSMILIRPSEKNGLADLENKLSSMSILELSSKMNSQDVDVMMPRFKIDFSTGLVDVLKEMGIRSIFEKADLPGIFESGIAVKVSDVKHKAFIDVNEAGSEAAAASFMEIMLMSLNLNQKYFTLDRPFVFAIKDSKFVYFVGHVVKF